MIIIPIILIIIALILVLAVGFWQTIIIVVIGAGVFGIIFFVLKSMFANPPIRQSIYQP